MSRIICRTLLAGFAASLLAIQAQAAPLWDESLNGDLSNNGLAPTSLIFATGSHIVLGTTGNSGSGIDRDYFSFTVPSGNWLTSITLLGNTAVSGSVSFIGLQSGPQVTVSPSGAGAENLLGFAHYGNDQIGTDLLPLLALGFPGSLPSGTYSVWIQETGGPASYEFDFKTTPVPLPGAALLLLSGLAGFAIRRKSRVE